MTRVERGGISTGDLGDMIIESERKPGPAPARRVFGDESKHRRFALKQMFYDLITDRKRLVCRCEGGWDRGREFCKRPSFRWGSAGGRDQGPPVCGMGYCPGAGSGGSGARRVGSRAQTGRRHATERRLHFDRAGGRAIKLKPGAGRGELAD